MTIDIDPHTAYVRVIDVVNGTDLLVSNRDATWQLFTTDVEQTYNSDQ
jgi:hypothetical protein